MSMPITAKDIAELRGRTAAGILKDIVGGVELKME